MLKRILVAIATILCISVSAFLTWDSPAVWERYVWYLFFGLAVVLVAVESIDSYFSDRALSCVRLELENVKKYGKYATWNMRGSQSVSDDYCLPGELTGWTDGFMREVDGVKQIRHDDEALAHYKDIMQRYPRYPFPYYMLAEAYRLRNESIWRQYAVGAITIFEVTTSLPGHAPDHEQALRNLKDALASESVSGHGAQQKHARDTLTAAGGS